MGCFSTDYEYERFLIKWTKNGAYAEQRESSKVAASSIAREIEHAYKFVQTIEHKNNEI